MDMTKTRTAVFGLILGLALAACDGGTAGGPFVAPNDPVEVRLTPSTIELRVGQDSVLMAQAYMADGSLTRIPLDWRSSAPATVSVDSVGVVKGIGMGTATIVASARNGTHGDAYVVVSEPARFELDASEVVLTAVAGQEDSVTAMVAVRNSVPGSLAPISVAVRSAGGPDWLSASLLADAAPTTLLLRADLEGLPAGEYSAEVLLSAPAASNSPATIIATLFVAPPLEPARIALDTAEVRLLWTEGSPPPGPKVVHVTNSGEQSLTGLSLNVEHLGSSSDWLIPELNSTTAPAELRLHVDPSQLAPGVHEALVEVASSIPGVAPVTLRTLLEIRERARMGVTPAVLSLSAPSGGLSTEATLNITNLGGGTLTGLSFVTRYAGGGAQGWLNLTPQSSSAPTSVHVQASPVAAPGIYHALVEISASSGPVVQVPVTLDVEAPLGIRLDPDSLVFTMRTDEWGSPTQVLDVFATGGGSPQRQISELKASIGWMGLLALDTRLASTTTPTQLSLTLLNRTGFIPQGTQRKELTVYSREGGNWYSATLTVVLHGTPPLPYFFNTLRMNVSGLNGFFMPGPSAFDVANFGAPALRDLSASVAYGPGASDWITVGPLPDSIPGIPVPPLPKSPKPWIVRIPISFQVEGLPVGNYEAEVRIDASNALRGPGKMKVFYTSLARPTMAVSPSALVFDTVRVGGSAPPSLLVRVEDQHGSSMPQVSMQVEYPSGGPTGWVQQSGQHPFEVSVQTQSLAEGTYVARLVVSSTAIGVANSPQYVDLTVTVVP